MAQVRGMHGKRLDDAIERVESLVARVLRGIARTVASLVGGSPSTAALSEDDLQVIRRDWTTAVGAELVPALGHAYLESAAVLAEEFADVGRPVEPVSLDAPATADFLDAATNRLVAVSDTLWEVARKELADGIRAGEGVEDLGARLQEAGGFGIVRARMIARTETIAAANAASLAQALRLGDASMTKTWADADDGRVRPAHVLADGQTVPIGDTFEVGGESLMYPGQPIGSAGNVINERCTLVYSFDDEPLTAAAEVHTGAMVALRPSVEDAARLAVDGGESADQLHTTLAYLGAAADIPTETQAAVIDAVWQIAEATPPVTAEGFAIDVFNPPGAERDDGKDRDTCIVLGLSGGDLEPVHSTVAGAVTKVFADAGMDLPEQHTPWIPHTTLTYTEDLSAVERLADRVGPVTFDAIRVAFAGEVFDIPLGEPEPDHDEGEADEGEFDWSAYFAAAIQAQFQSRMPPQLQAYWIRKLRLGSKGSFDRCVRELREYFPEDTEGLCANLYHTATGRWPGRKKDNSSDGVTALAAEPETVAAEAEEPAAEAGLEPLPGEHFHTWVMEGVSTGLRQFAPDSITWRTPPFAFHDQYKSSAHGGVPETVQTGLVTRVRRLGNTVHFWGRLDLRSPMALDYARRLAEGWARWSSVGADESVKDQYIDVEYVLGDGDDVVMVEDPEIELMTFNAYRVAEVTAVSVPALADALVEPTPELINTLTEMGVIEPVQMDGEAPAEEKQEDEMADFAAVRPHDTPTTEGTWDADANVGRLPSPLPVTVAREEFAWIDDARIEGDHIPKDAASLPHHEVSEDGRVGAANIDGVRNALARLSQTDIPESEREAVHAHLARHLEDAGGTPSEFANAGPSVIVAAGHTITIPDVPPAEWFAEPTDVDAAGALTITDEGRIYGYLAPAGVAHRSFRNRRVEVPRGNVDYSRWMGGEAIVAGGGRVVAGPITMNCGHMPPTASSDPGARMEHYDNTCSVVAHATIGENNKGVWIAGALLPGVTADQVSRMLTCRLSGDWAPHPEKRGMREFVAALLVPVPGFPMARSAPSRMRIADGALVASAVPVRFAEEETVVEIEETAPLAEGTRVRLVDPRDPEVTEGKIAMVHMGPAYAINVPGRDEPHRWYVADEVEPVGDTDEVDEVEEMVVAAGGPDLGPVLDFVARRVGRDPASRMTALRDRVHRN